MNKLIKTLAVSGLVLGGAISAQAADLSVLFANTLKFDITDPAGNSMSANYLYNEDGTVDVVTSQGSVKGSWEVKGDELCTSVTDPSGNSENNCNPVSEMAGAAPGDSFEFSPAEGVTIKGTLVAGR